MGRKSDSFLKIRCSFGLISVVLIILSVLSGCMIRVRDKERPLVRFQHIRGELQLDTEYRNDKETTSQIVRNGKNLSLEEKLTLSTRGDVYHPNLLEYKAALGLGLVQQYFQFNNQNSATYSDISEYNISMNFLKTKDYPVTVFSNKSRILVPRQFLGSLSAREQNAGVVWNYRSENTPMFFQWLHSNSTQNPLGSAFDDPLISQSRQLDFFSRNADNFSYNVSHDFSKNSRLRFRTDRDNITQRRANTITNIKRQRYLLDHELLFGPDDKYRLDSTGQYREQSGTVNLRMSKWAETLTLQHTDNFQTNYDLSYIKDERVNLESREWRGGVGFEHRLYESLVNTGRLYGVKSDLDAQGKMSLWGGQWGVDYRKNNPWGTLTAGYTANYTSIDLKGAGEIGVVVDESHTFHDPYPIILERRNIDIESIIITDSTGLELYSKGDDYTVSLVNGQVHLNMSTMGIVTPNVTDNQVLLVSYNFVIEPQRREDTLQQNFRIRQQFHNGLGFYYRYDRRDESVSSNFEKLSEDDYRTNTYGVDFTRGGFHVLGEYSRRSSSRSPFTSSRIEGRYHYVINTRSSANMRASQTWLDYGGITRRNTEVLSLGGDLYTELNRQLGIDFNVDWRDEDDSNAGIIRGFSTGSELRYRYRQFNLTTGVEYNQLQRQGRDNRSTYFYVRIKRFF